MTVRSITQETEVSRFLYYFFLCLCKSFKELFLQCSSTTFSAKADAKVRQISELPKLFQLFFRFSQKKVSSIDVHQRWKPLLLILYIEGDYLLSSGAWPISSMNSSSFGVMIIWVRRLRCLPSSLVLGWRGLYSPRPPAVRRLGSTP